MKTAVFNIEANGLLPDVTSVWNLVVKDTETLVVHQFDELHIAEGITLLQKYDIWVGHNILQYDIQVLNKLYNLGYLIENSCIIIDTLLISRILNPTMDGGHSLKNWAKKLGLPKGEQPDFSKPSEELMKHCIENVGVADSIYRVQKFDVDKYGEKFKPALKLYADYSFLMGAQQRAGAKLDIKKANIVYEELSKEKDVLSMSISNQMPKITLKEQYIDKRGKLHLAKYKEPNPNSADQIKALFLSQGWKPSKTTPSGKAKLDKEEIQYIDLPIAREVDKLRKITKILGFIKTGAQSWLNCVKADGRVHGNITVCGAATGRCTASNPNMQQIPKAKVDKRLKEVWIAEEGYKLVGCDASQIELRVQGHYLANYDSGMFANLVMNNVDIHEHNRVLLGLNERDNAKNIKYAFDYGSGLTKLGLMFNIDQKLGLLDSKELINLGKTVKGRLEKGVVGLKSLLDAIKKNYQQKKFLYSISGRPMFLQDADKEYALFNLLIQGSTADIMAKTCVNFYYLMLDRGLKLGYNYNYVMNVHDEIVIEAKEECAEIVKELLEQSWAKSGEDFQLRCKLKGQANVGNNWSELK